MKIWGLAGLAAIGMLSGCASLAPQPLSAVDVTTQAQQDRQTAALGVDPITGPVRLEEAIARALKYNLQRRTRMMEEALAVSQLDVSQYDMLP
jgi:hypothetical protein